MKHAEVLNVLERADRYVTGRIIGQQLGISGMEVREAVNALRVWGLPICSSSRGYRLTTDRAELTATIRSIEGRISAMQAAVSGLRDALEFA